MSHDWKEIVTDLYEKISPISGNLNSQIDNSFISKRKLENVWVDFEMNDFMYLDPFYGEQKSTAPFRMNFSLWDILGNEKIETIFDIENLELNLDKKSFIGAFSNSLVFSVPFLRFGKIDGYHVPFEMEYILSNSDSYAMMTGTADDHIALSGRISLKLEIKELLILIRKGDNPINIARYLDKKRYNLKGIREAKDTGIEYHDYDLFWISYKKQKKKWWQI